ncbi:MAG: crossover junction endodeoxyribonuclease RuvC [Phycisphaerales bacterium]|nr:crossover junction endodeoxyribonuclease RuvC [Phycisphaerales bacterium]
MQQTAAIPAHKSQPRRYLGVDPGLHRTGYAVLESCASGPRVVEAGVVRLERGASLAARLGELDRCLGEIIATHTPNVMVCEELYAHYRHPRTAILMGHARGVILALGSRYSLDVMSIAATRVKKLLTGKGHAGKAQMQRCVTMTLGLDAIPEPNDVADAMGIAYCGLHSELTTSRAAASGGAKRGRLNGVMR